MVAGGLVSVAAEPAGDRSLAAAAAALADELGLPCVAQPEQASTPMVLVRTAERLELRVLHGDPLLVGGRAVAIDLTQLDTRSGPGRRLRQPLLRAAGLRKGEPRPSVLDATAGLGEDAWLLAAAGCTVTAVERSPVVAALLADAVARAARASGAGGDSGGISGGISGDDSTETAARLQVVAGDSAAVLRRLAAGEGERPAVVYLDPMFPTGRKTVERKPMRVLRWLVGADADAAELFDAALGAALRRVVVKRPSRAAVLGGREPTHAHHGKSVRYDVYVIAGA